MVSNERRTDTATLVSAMRVLAAEIQSGDGISNAACQEAAERIEELAGMLEWHTGLHVLVGDCIREHNNGFDALASSAWDRIVEYCAEVQ